MINLNQNNTKAVKLTLSESAIITATTVYYLFRFKSDTTHEELFFTAPDVSTNLVRYNQFNITLTGAAYTNLTAGTISLPDCKGVYDVFEQTSQTNLALSGTNGISIETGIFKVSGSTNQFITNYYTGSSSSYTYYEPQN